MAPNHFDGICRTILGTNATANAPVMIYCWKTISHANGINRASILTGFATDTGFEICLSDELACHQKVPWHPAAFVIA